MKTVKRLRPLLFAAALISVCTTQAAPESPTIRTGSASVSVGASTVINQSTPTLAIDWASFDVSATESVRFNQPSASSVALNRVTGGSPSSIFGRIDANGKIILVNSAGILFGKTAQVNTGAFVASSMELDETTLGADRLRFSGPGAKIENAGALNGQEFVAVVAPSIDNSGTVRGGSVALAAGAEVIISTSSGLFDVQVPVGAVTAAIENKGGVVATQGVAYLTARGVSAATSALSNPGRVEATGLVERDGRIYLESEGALTTVGTVKATRAADGGDIEIKGGFVALGGAVSADGAKGGTVKVESKGMLSLADQVTAKGLQASGGSITYHSLGQTIENSTGFSDTSGRTDGGKISLNAEQGVMSSGTYLASGATGKGGMIDLTGFGVRLLSATLDASGMTQGGLIRVGGAFQGGKNLGIRGDNGDLLQSYVGRWGSLSAITNSQRTLVNDSTVINVSSTSGEGGTAIVWSDLQTTMAGKILAGGVRGGVAEISSADELRKAAIDQVVSARHILLDPKNIIIGNDSDFGSWTYSAIIGAGYSGGANLDLNASNNANLLGQSLEVADGFGQSVSLNATGNLMAVGAYQDDGFGNQVSNAGAVYLYSFTDAHFSGGSLKGVVGRGYVGGSNVDVTTLEAFDGFGQSVSLNATGNLMAVGAFQDDGFGNQVSNAGAVYLVGFTNSWFSGGSIYGVVGSGYVGGNNVGVTALEAFDGFGQSVSLNATGNRMVVGAYQDDGFGNQVSNSGAVYLVGFTNSWFAGGSIWGAVGSGYMAVDKVDLTIRDMFGSALSLNAAGNRLAVGSPGDDGAGYVGVNDYDYGNVRLFTFQDVSFVGGSLASVIGKGYVGGLNIDVTDLTTRDMFGSAVSLNAAGDRLAVGSPGDDGAGYVGVNDYDYGNVRLFKLDGPPLANYTFGSISGTDGLIDSTQVASALASGTAITLQANNDITIASPIDAGAGSAGALLLYAGRSVRFDADVRVGSRGLGVIANASAADGVIGAHRDAGQGGFVMSSGVSVVAGDFAVLVRGVDASSSNPNSSPGSVTLGNVTASRLAVGISGSGLSGRTISQNAGSSIAVASDVILGNQAGDISLAEAGNGAWSGTTSLSASGSLAVRSSSGLTIDTLNATSFDIRSSGVVNVNGPVSLGASGYGFISSTNAFFSDDITLAASADMRVNASGSITLAGITPSLAAGSQLRFYGCDDVVVSAPIAAASGSVGELRLTAGRDVKLNASVDLGGADLYARANAKVSDGIFGAYRPVGQGDFTMASGTSLEADSVTVIVRGVDADVTNVNSSPGGIVLADVDAGSLTLAIEGSGFTDRAINQYAGSGISVAGNASIANSLGNTVLSSVLNGAWRGTTTLSSSGTTSLKVASSLTLGGLSASGFTVVSSGPMRVGGATALGSFGSGLLQAPGIDVASSVSVGMFATLNAVSSREMRLTGASASMATGASLRLWSTNLAIDTTNRLGYNYKLYGATYGVSNVTSTGIGWIFSLSSPYAISVPSALQSSSGLSLQTANYYRPVTPAFLGAYPMASPAIPRSFESFFNSGELILPILSAPYQWDAVQDDESSSWLLDTKRDSASTTPAPTR